LLKHQEDGRIKASPLAKKIAQDKGINLDAVAGSGPEGRIIKKDVEEFVPQTTEAVKTQQPIINIPQIVGEEGYDETPVSQMRKVIASRLSQSKFTAPHFYLTISVDMDNAIAARKSLNEVSPLKISFNDLIVKASAMALRRNPAVNSSWLGDTIRTYKHIHIGVAVAINDGLVVPVIRFADNKSLSQIAAETGDLAERAKNRKLQPTDWEGNTFTISNLGMMGIEEFTAIINPPDACILAVGGIQQVPVVKNGQVVPGNVMKLTMSCDHRVVDGAVGAKFLQTLKQYLEDPVRMLA
jgi:pyruvate dehydrogenase E2 component (dihydrolipoamide acetyltransferase)